jgi:hypothetical protein
MIHAKLLVSLLAAASVLGEEDGPCDNLARFRTDYISHEFDDQKAAGFFYENAYQDLAQVGSSCGYYSKNATGTGDVIEQFGFTYKNPGHMMLKYTNVMDSNQLPELGIYTKKIDKGEDGFGPPISSVVVVMPLLVSLCVLFRVLHCYIFNYISCISHEQDATLSADGTTYASLTEVNKIDALLILLPHCLLIIDIILSISGCYFYLQYACFTIGPITYKEIRIGSRSPAMSADELAEKEEVLAKQGVEYRELKVVDQSGCQYDINDGVQ